MFLISWMSEGSREWFSANGIYLLLGGLIAVQWILLQAFWIHYSLFRSKLQKPNRDLIRLSLLEKTVAFQADQMNAAFKKMNDLRREISQAASLHEAAIEDFTGRSSSTGGRAREGSSLETSYMSLGELQLKKRIEAMKGEVAAQTVTSTEPQGPSTIQ